MDQSGDPHGNVARMLWDTAHRLPGKTAIVEPERQMTYRDVRARASAVAGALDGAGIAPGDRVVVLLDRGGDAVASYFGVVATGALAVLLNSVLRPRQIEYALDHSGAKILLTSRDVLARMHREIETDARILQVEDVVGDAGDVGSDHGDPGPVESFEPLRRSPADPAQITYTSGSTGMPKGVVGGHGNVWSAIETVAGYLGLEEEDRIAGLLPFSGVYGSNQMLCSTLMGGTLVVPRSPLMNEIARELKEAEATVLAAVPPLWMRLIRAPEFTEEPIPSLRILQNAGGHLAPAAVQKLREIQPQAKIFLQYGMTEVFRSSFLPPEEIDRRPESMGRAMPGTEILVVREDDTLCEPGEVGELVHSGPTVSHGYWEDPEKTEEVFRPHPVDPAGPRVVYSGDMVRRDEEGFLYFVGRRDRMIKTLGYRVGPDEILDVLYASGEIREGVVTSEDDPVRGQKVVAYVVLTDDGSVKRLKRFCGAELPRYMQPTEIVAVEELPRTATGKHDLLALRESAAGR